MIDASDRTAVAVCDICGSRVLRLSRAAARRYLAAHEAEHHPSSRNARDADRQATRRAEATAPRAVHT